jgi:uncharacterized protein YidB (DUF937 family)
MSFFDNISSLIGNAINNHPGGLTGLMSEAFTDFGGLDGVVAKLNEAGLGARVNSWLGRGDNQPISPDEIRSALSSEYLGNIAQRLGVPVDQVANILAQHLPAAVDQASPNGALQTP